MTIAVIGGTGKEGRGLVLRLATQASEEVIIIGSRQREKARAVAAELNLLAKHATIIGQENRDAARQADVIILTVPYSAHERTIREIAEEMAGKILVDATVPLDPTNPCRLKRRSELSAAEEAQALLGDTVKVVAAFQNVSARALRALDEPVQCDVLVCGDDAEAKGRVMRLITRMGFRALDAGPLEMARLVEALTPLLISLNLRYRSKTTGIRITGLDHRHDP
ncbi:MAG TPA: NADPH-dependent F420 reductase [Blastocatellia bacterium]|nr:NADPH-dependent F420 reductase [Blastocatellia bacterium]